MKAKTNSKKEQSATKLNKGEKLTIVIVVITLLLLLLLSSGKAQAQNMIKGKIGFSISSTVTGSGHGTNYSPQIHYNFKNNSISVGPNIQKRLSHLSGVQFNYERTVCTGYDYEDGENIDTLLINESFDDDMYNDEPYNKNVELFLVVNTIYHYSANLSEATITGEPSLAGSSTSLSDFKYRTLESYAGFGLRIRINDNLKWSNNIACGAYISSKGPCLARMQKDVSLLLRTSLCYTF